MAELILMRHAAALPAATGQSDFERPLSGRGRGAALQAAKRLAAGGAKVARLIYSPARRTHETATIVARELGLETVALHGVPELYSASAETMRAVVINARATASVVLLVGHNPGISDLGQVLASGLLPEQLPTAGFWRLSFDPAHWPSLKHGTARATDPA